MLTSKNSNMGLLSVTKNLHSELTGRSNIHTIYDCISKNHICCGGIVDEA
jgi:hypothetical protein